MIDAFAAALAGAGAAVFGGSLAALYRVQQRLVVRRWQSHMLVLAFAGSLLWAWPLHQRPPLPLLRGARDAMTLLSVSPFPWLLRRALDRMPAGGPPSGVAGAAAAAAGILLAAALPLSRAAIPDHLTGILALVAMTVRLVAPVPVAALAVAGAAVRLLLP